MASGIVVNQGKTPFTREQLEKNSSADADAISEAWQKSGHDGTISPSLVYKIKTEMGLTGRGKPGRPAKSAAAVLKRSKPRGRPRKNPLPVPPVAAGRRVATRVTAKAHDEDEVLDGLEDAIDDLIGKIKQVGEHTEAVRALRKARRLLGHPQG